MTEIIDFESLRTGKDRLFQGADHGDVDVSFFLVDEAPGRGPALHRHPYAEVFVVLEGCARFVVGDQQLDVQGGHVVVAPAGRWHRFHNAGDGPLKMVNIHPSDRTVGEWFEERVT